MSATSINDPIEAVCNRLARRGLFFEERGLAAWPDGTVSGLYGFQHGLYQNVPYQGLTRGQRARLDQQREILPRHAAPADVLIVDASIFASDTRASVEAATTTIPSSRSLSCARSKAANCCLQ